MSWISARTHYSRASVQVRRFLLVLCFFGWFFSAAGEQEPVRIGLTRESSAAPFLIAIEAGYFEAEGLAPQVTFFKTDSLVLAAVASGKVDIGMAALSAAFYSYAAANSLKIIASRSSDHTGFPMYALLISKKAHAAGFSGVRGLSNARIGVASTASGAYYGLLSIESRFKLKPGSIKPILLKSTAGEFEAFSRGEIDGALLPFPTALHSAIGGRSLLLLSDFTQWQEGVVFTTAGNIATKRNLIERFLRGYQRGTADYQLNFLSYDDGGDFIPGPRYNKYLDLIARRVQIPSDVLARTKTYCDRRANLDVADIGKQVQFWQEQGWLDKAIAVSELLDVSFIGEETSAPH